MALDMKTDTLEYFISDIGCMPYTVYRIHDTTNHLLTICINICLSIHSTIHSSIHHQLFFLSFYVELSIVITITFIE